jgi:hypothetical protein
MKNEKSYFGAGLIVGIILSALFILYFAPRYSTVQSGENIIKQDRWSGQSWRYADNQWKTISNISMDWERIDQSLRDALNIPFAKVDTHSALSKLKENYPALKDVPDDDLLERIKIVYSKQVLCNLYLNQYMEAERDRSQGSEINE